MAVCYIGIGANLGERSKNIKGAVSRISGLRKTRVIKRSGLFASKAVGGPKGQPDFLNAAVKVETGLSAFSLLKELKAIEKEMGRKKTVRFGPRVIDLDILLYADKTIRGKNLTVPHPRMFDRDFVIRPLKEVI